MEQVNFLLSQLRTMLRTVGSSITSARSVSPYIMMQRCWRRISADCNYSASFLNHKIDYELNCVLDFTDDSAVDEQKKEINCSFSLQELHTALLSLINRPE